MKRLQRRRATWKKKKSKEDQEDQDDEDDDDDDFIDEGDDMASPETKETEDPPVPSDTTETIVDKQDDKGAKGPVTQEDLFGSTSDISSSDSSKKDVPDMQETNVEMAIDQVCLPYCYVVFANVDLRYVLIHFQAGNMTFRQKSPEKSVAQKEDNVPVAPVAPVAGPSSLSILSRVSENNSNSPIAPDVKCTLSTTSRLRSLELRRLRPMSW